MERQGRGPRLAGAGFLFNHGTGMSNIVGIDLGTTNSLVATVDSGIPYVIADAEGQRLTPSVVHVPAGGGEPWVGHKANRVRVLRPTGDRVFREAIHGAEGIRDSA